MITMTEFQRQKQEAENRARRMNEEYRKKSATELQKQVQHNEEKSPMDLLRMFRFDALKSDPDRILIICVFLLLSKEKCDEKLLYALLYIML